MLLRFAAIAQAAETADTNRNLISVNSSSGGGSSGISSSINNNNCGSSILGNSLVGGSASRSVNEGEKGVTAIMPVINLLPYQNKQREAAQLAAIAQVIIL